MHIPSWFSSGRRVRAHIGPWLCAGLLFGAPSRAGAALILADPGGGTTIDFSQFLTPTYGNGLDPLQVQVGGLVGEDVMFMGNEYSFVGFGDAFLVPSLKSWTDQTYAGVNDPNRSITFIFGSGPVLGVGGFMNYADESRFIAPVLIQLLAADLTTVLESYSLNSTAPITDQAEPGATGPQRPGAFRGIVRPGTDAHAFRIIGGYAVIDDLTFWREAPGPPPPSVPEPLTALLLALGTGAALLRRTF